MVVGDSISLPNAISHESTFAFEIAEIQDFADFLPLAAEWNDLLAESHVDIPFLTHEWIATWWKHFAAHERITCLLGRRAGRLVFALPLLEERQRLGPLRIKVLRSPTNTHSFRFHFLLAKGCEDVLDPVWEFLLQRPRRWDILLLTDVPMDSGTHEFMQQAVGRHGGRTGIWHACRSAFLDTSCDWNNYEQTISKSVRKMLRNRRNRLGKMGDVQMEMLTKPVEVEGALHEAFEIERRSWKGERGSAIACNPSLVAFYTDMAQIAAERGWMRLSFLRVGEERTAFEYALEYNRHLYSIKIGYDAERFREFSAGRLLVRDSMERCFRDGVSEYDFIGPLTDTQRDWKPATREIGWIYYYRKSLAARLHCLLKFQVNPGLKKTARWVGLTYKHE